MFRYEEQLWDSGMMYVAGIDEAGRGPLAGPVVAAAVIFSRSTRIFGVRDSKCLTADARERLFKEIIKHAIDVGTGMVDAWEIDSTNILQATLKAMQAAVDSLKVRPQHLLVDGRQVPDCDIPRTAIVKGDQNSFSVAAASIIAKVTRDHLMIELDREYPGYGFVKHKGYGTMEHILAIEKRGFSPVHRRSFHVRLLDRA
jgi:ribonuclease HII